MNKLRHQQLYRGVQIWGIFLAFDIPPCEFALPLATSKHVLRANREIRVFRSAFLVLFALMISGARSGSPQTPSTAASNDPQAVALLAQCYAAMGSPDATLSLSAAGTIADTDHPQLASRSLSIKILGPTKLRREEEIAGSTAITIVNGSRAAWRSQANAFH